ncbi:prepilin-type N-terminal cleavage/methylation domain-containing protein [Marinobacterium sp. D7]|uniref:prepilin-type N-terminal cleavage/methylation domain-containing protein n=1 Tax=Marinobacterium ramblicola TaxID=2849041 RepID=UPI001C2D35E6|nr:prepilin-type N-terminal cleavage/methylation domain-containing protein [Marinobacterium ramblicola]MBV1786687.1 prepilin-type N-terminal cleavage/methylation domain-containing protein [Marinobacterium ramblicola]
MSAIKQERGFTLIELMIALLLGLIVTGIAISMYVSTLGITRQTVTSVRLSQELRTVMDMMVRDIRRSGYWAGTVIANNPHAGVVSGGLPVNVFTSPNSSDSNSCVVLSYDYDADGSATIEHLMGYRMDDAQSAVEVLWASSSTLTGGVNCSVLPGNWQNLTDESTTVITQLLFERLPSAASFASAAARSIRITLRGESASDNRLVKELIEEVRVRNDL